MEKEKVGVKKTLEYKDAVAYLEALTKSLKSGTIVIESGEDHVVMKPSAQVSIKLEAKTKKDKQKIALEIAWTDASTADLKISEIEPGAVPAEKEPAQVPATQSKAEVPAKVEPAKVKSAKAPTAKTATKTPAKKPKVTKSKPKKTSTTKASAAADKKK